VADLHVDANVTAPATVNVPLVRADMMGMSSTFRVFFDVFLAAAMMLLGATLSSCNAVPTVQWVFFWFCAVGALSCFVASLVWSRRAHTGA
jgi:hypothetical protein